MSSLRVGEGGFFLAPFISGYLELNATLKLHWLLKPDKNRLLRLVSTICTYFEFHSWDKLLILIQIFEFYLTISQTYEVLIAGFCQEFWDKQLRLKKIYNFFWHSILISRLLRIELRLRLSFQLSYRQLAFHRLPGASPWNACHDGPPVAVLSF